MVKRKPCWILWSLYNILPVSLLLWTSRSNVTIFHKYHFRVSNKLAESLKSLYSTFASPLVQNSADLLSRDFTKAEITASSAKPVCLISHILSTLQNIFLYCNSFVNANRFNVLLEPLVNLLDHEEYLADKNISELLPKLFAQFAMAANNDLLWKELNHQILMKTRSNSVVVRWVLATTI